MWTAQTKYKSTIKTAVDYLVGVDPGQENQGDAFPLVAAALAAYGDDQKATYQHFLENGGNKERNSKRSGSYPYKSKTWWFYQQPDALKHIPVATHRRNLPQYTDDSLYQYAPINQEILGNMPPMSPAFNSTVTTDNLTLPSRLSTSGLHSTMSVVSDSGTAAAPDASGSCTMSSQDKNTESGCDHTREQDIEGMKPGPGDIPVLHPERPEPFASTDAVELDEGIYVYWWQIRHLYEQSSGMKRSAWARW